VVEECERSYDAALIAGARKRLADAGLVSYPVTDWTKVGAGVISGSVDIEDVPLTTAQAVQGQKIYEVLILCNQNRERSPMVAHMMRSNMPEDLENKVTIRSGSIYDTMADQAVEDNISRDSVLRDHMPQQATKEDLLKADIIFVMTQRQKDDLEKRYSHLIGKIHLVLSHESFPGSARS
jgi:protein-tyrosine-phosphatase